MSEFSFTCSLIIRNDKIDFNKIEDELGIKATEKYYKGEFNNIAIGEHKKDMFIYNFFKDEEDTMEKVLDDLVNICLKKEDVFLKNFEKYEVEINCYIQTIYAQFYTIFNSDIIQKLSRLNVDFTVNITSFGVVE